MSLRVMTKIDKYLFALPQPPVIVGAVAGTKDTQGTLIIPDSRTMNTKLNVPNGGQPISILGREIYYIGLQNTGESGGQNLYLNYGIAADGDQNWCVQVTPGSVYAVQTRQAVYGWASAQIIVGVIYILIEDLMPTESANRLTAGSGQVI